MENLNKKIFLDRKELGNYLWKLPYKTQSVVIFDFDEYHDGLHVSEWYDILSKKSSWVGLVEDYGEFFVPFFNFCADSYNDCLELFKEVPNNRKRDIYIGFVF